MIEIRKKLRQSKTLDEHTAMQALMAQQPLGEDVRERITRRAIKLVDHIRAETDPSTMELFLAEYGLSSDEGVALMCLAEALLRVPDDATMDALIEDKIATSDWNKHLGKSHSSLINASTWALYVTGKVLDDDHEEKGQSVLSALHGVIKRLGEPVIRQAVTQIMKELGQQFVLGESIEKAMDRASQLENQGYTYSYDMLGEAARTESDARRYYLAYSQAISQIARVSQSADMRDNPGISVKLSALHPRYEILKKSRVMRELMPRARSLAILAKSAGIGLDIDAEESGRLDLSLDIIEAIVADPALENWDGMGVVVQAYGQRAPAVIDWLYQLAKTHDRRLMVRLVKGAYWDTEIKHAQVEGLDGFPVFTRKPFTDVSFICCAQKLLAMTDRLYPQFATHNAHTVAAILELAEETRSTGKFEFQRLHGMGEALHDTVLKRHKTRCRIYAPVGVHTDLLAYLVRRLLENGANSSFVNQIVDETVPSSTVAADPFVQALSLLDERPASKIARPADLFVPERTNSKGWDLEHQGVLARLEKGIARYQATTWKAVSGTGETLTVHNPANGETVGTVTCSTLEDTQKAIAALSPWNDLGPKARQKVLNRAAQLYEKHHLEIFALLMREAGKTLADCVNELREAVDFLRYYADQATGKTASPAGVFACISPWNFPLAIFTGQISAALAAGNAVIAKPAETTPLIAQLAVDLLHRAGVPAHALQMAFGTGASIGRAITENNSVNGICFTGSTATAGLINRSMAQHLAPHAPLIAETGGLNAMIVDSTALPEQAINDIVASAFQSAGQRCSALRVLYLQEDVAEKFQAMLYGAMDELEVGDPTRFQTDIGPVIDQTAKDKITAHIETAKSENRLVKHIDTSSAEASGGHFIGPAVISLDHINQLKEEIFGPVLHVITYKHAEFEQIIRDINATGFGLTFGMHSRIDDRVQYAIDHIEAGNIYINRNQIGAVVGSQPFGGEGLSGTGPKAGGPRYLDRFYKEEPAAGKSYRLGVLSQETIDTAFAALEKSRGKENRPPQAHLHEAVDLPGPTGESNRYTTAPRGRVLCLGPTAERAEQQANLALKTGCCALAVAPGVLAGLDGAPSADALMKIRDLEAVICQSDELEEIRRVLSRREGPIVPLLSGCDFTKWLKIERHVCVDTTAAGGNAALLAG